MPNEVRTQFTGDTTDLFKAADAAEKRVKQYASTVNNSTAIATRPPNTVSGAIQSQAGRPVVSSIGVVSMTVTRLIVTQFVGASGMPQVANSGSNRNPQTAASTFGTAAGAVIGGAIAGTAILATKEFIDAQIEAENRVRKVRAEIIGLGKDAQTVAAQAQKYAADANLSLDEAAGIYVQIVKLAKDNVALTVQLQTSAVDVGAFRNLSTEDIAKGLSEINDGVASSILFGKNAASVFQLYADSIGKVASELTPMERRQAQINQLLKEGALNAGEAAKQNNTLGGSFRYLANSVEQLLTTGTTGKGVGGIASGIRGLGDFFSGGPSAVWNNPKARREAAARAEADAAAAQAKTYEESVARVRAADLAPKSSLVNFGLSNFLDRKAFTNTDASGREELVRVAVADAETYKKTFTDKLSTLMANPFSLGIARTKLLDMKGIFGDDEYRDLSNKVADAMSAGAKKSFEQMFKSGWFNSLTDFRKQVEGDVALNPTDRGALLDLIEADVKKGKEKIKELSKTWRETFDGLLVSSAGDNPFVKIWADSNKALNQLRENLRGLPPELQKAAEDTQRVAVANQMFSARVENAFGAFDHRERARELRAMRDPIPTEEQFLKALDSFGQKFVKPVYDVVRVGASESVMLRQRNPFLAYDRTQMPDGTFQTVSRDIRANMFAAYHQNGTPEGTTHNLPGVGNRTFITGGTIRQERTWEELSDREKQTFYAMFQQRDPNTMRVRDRFDTQLRIASSFKPENDQQRAELDSRIVALGNAIDPREMRNDQREQLALANERLAERRERREIDMLDVATKHLELDQRRWQYEQEKTKDVERNGSRAVEFTFRDQTENGVRMQERRPTPSDTSRRFDLGLSGGLGGRGDID